MGRNAGGMASPIRPFVCQTVTDICRLIKIQNADEDGQDLYARISIYVYTCEEEKPRGRLNGESKRKSVKTIGKAIDILLHTGIGEY